MRYFWPTDLTLRSKIPVIKKNCMKLSFLLIAFATKPSDFLGFWTPALEELEAMDPTKELVDWPLFSG